MILQGWGGLSLGWTCGNVAHKVVATVVVNVSIGSIGWSFINLYLPISNAGGSFSIYSNKSVSTLTQSNKHSLHIRRNHFTIPGNR